MDRAQRSDGATQPPASRSKGQSEAFHRSDEQFRLLVEEVTEYAIFRLDPDGRVTNWNAGAERIKGYRAEEILGRHISCFYTTEDVEAGLPTCVLEAAARDGQWTGEGWRVRRDGTRFWAHVTITALTGEEGTLRGFAKVTRDMTERHRREEALRQREQALRESERRYHRLFEEAQEGIGITTPAGEILDVNPATEEILGYRREELLAMNAAELYVDPEERRKGADLMARRGALRDFEARMRHKDGREVICRLSSTVRRGPDGEIEAFQTFFRDVTEKKRVEEALRESEAKFRVLAEKALVGVGLVQDGVYQYVNPAFARIVGYTREELVGASPERLFHPGDWPAIQKRVKRRLAGAMREAHYQARMCTKAGRIRRVEIFGSRIVYRGRPALIGTIMDITERRHLQREVLRVQEEERRRLGQDLHDGVASQLTGIAILLGTLSRQAAEEDEELAAQIEETQELVRESGQDVRRLSRGLAPAGLSSKELASVLKRLVNNVEGGHFESDMATLPVLEDDVAAHLYWIAQEATTNARKYAEAETVTIRLTRGESGALVLEIEDDGRGFDGAEVEVEDSLGLRTMRYRAELLGAAFTIDSNPGEGTRVCCRIPA